MAVVLKHSTFSAGLLNLLRWLDISTSSRKPSCLISLINPILSDCPAYTPLWEIPFYLGVQPPHNFALGRTYEHFYFLKRIYDLS